MKYLFCIGAQKTGTTYLANLLRQHSTICFGSYKELHFFSNDSEYEKGIEYFHNQFKPDDNTEYLADFTPEYLPKKKAFERIYSNFDDKAKLIVLVRDPVKRAFSQYKMKMSNKKTSKSFRDIVEKEINEPVNPRSITGRSLYALQLDRLFEIFKTENVFIGRLEDLSEDTEGFLREIYDFLEIEYEKIEQKVFLNSQLMTTVGPVRGFLYRVPLVYRRKFRALGKLPAMLLKWVFDTKHRIPFEPPELDEDTKRVLIEYYKEPNRILNEKYGIRIDDWM